MIKPSRIRVTMIAAVILTAGAANVPAAAAPIETAAAAGPTYTLLLSRETSAYEAWKSRDAQFWQSFLDDRFVGWGLSGRLDKESASKEYTGADCAIARVAISDAQVTPLGRDAALITHRTSVDGACGGAKLPRDRWAASVYVRDGDQWKAAFHAEAAIVDPKAPMKPAGKPAAGEQDQTNAADLDAASDALIAAEKAAWGAWKTRDTKRMDDLLAANVQFINIFGIHLATKAEALNNWSGKDAM